MKIRTDIYERVNGKKPRGRSYWRFQLVTDRVTEKDHFFSAKVDMTYEAAAKEAIDLAVRRRSTAVVLMP